MLLIKKIENYRKKEPVLSVNQAYIFRAIETRPCHIIFRENNFREIDFTKKSIPIPAEQCMTFGEIAVEGCIDVTVFKNFKNVVVEAGTPKSGHVK